MPELLVMQVRVSMWHRDRTQYWANGTLPCPSPNVVVVVHVNLIGFQKMRAISMYLSVHVDTLSGYKKSSLMVVDEWTRNEILTNSCCSERGDRFMLKPE